MDHFGLDLLLAMSIGAEFPVRTFRDRVGPVGAETFPIALKMVLLLHWRVALGATVTGGTFLAFFYKVAHRSRVKISWSATVLFIMIVDAKFVVMFNCDIARGDLEDIEIQLLNLKGNYFDDCRRSELVTTLAGMSVICKVLAFLTQLWIVGCGFWSSHRFYNL